MVAKMEKFERYHVWQAGERYRLHRIPGMIVTRLSTVIIYNEARYSPSDWSLMDVFAQRSTDGGKTFGPPIYLARGDDHYKTVNNPVMVQDKNGRIHFLHCQDYGVGGGRIWRRYSDDDGLTWSDPVDITAYTCPEKRNAVAFGPGHGICSPSGDLLVPMWMVPKSYESPLHAHNPAIIGAFYSLDNGETWRVGDQLGSCYELQSPNETEFALLSDGRVYLNCRSHNFFRSCAVSDNGYTDWQNFGPDKRLIDPRCCGGVASNGKQGKDHLLIFANCESKTARDHVTVKASDDDGRTWRYRRMIDEANGGYVEVNVDPRSGNIYVLYEQNDGENCYLAVFNEEWLKAGTQ